MSATISAETPRASASDFVHQTRPPLDAIFSPRSVAVIGASETAGSVGRTVLSNLIHTPFGGAVYPVNPKRPNILGIKAYPSIKAVPERVDLAVIVTPAASVPAVVGECADAGVRAAIVISAGFKELGPSGLELEHQVLEQARRGRMRLIGPNCLGVMCPMSGLNATFAHRVARPGNRGVRQPERRHAAPRFWTGACASRSASALFVSAGSMLDVGWGDLDRLPGRRSKHPQHRGLYGIDRRCAIVHVGRARGGDHQADHRHQSPAERSRPPRPPLRIPDR
jgi:acetyltransferase